MAHKILYRYQFLFILGSSTNHALPHFTNMIANPSEEGHFDFGKFLYLSKVFNAIHHNILFIKFRHCGGGGNVFKLA